MRALSSEMRVCSQSSVQRKFSDILCSVSARLAKSAVVVDTEACTEVPERWTALESGLCLTLKQTNPQREAHYCARVERTK